MIPRLSALIARERSRDHNALLLDAGDLALSSPTADVGINLLRTLRYDALTPGNAENDFPEKRAAMSRIGAPIVVSNILADPLRIPMQPYLLCTIRGIRIAIIGLTTPPLSQNTSVYPANHPFHQTEDDAVTIAPPIETAQQWIPQLRKEADMVIVLSHLGLWSDVELASAVPGIDLIIGGHSHHRLVHPIRIGKTTIVQAGVGGAYLGVVRAHPAAHGFDFHGEIEPVWQPIDTDETAEKIIHAYVRQYMPSMLESIGTIEECWADPWLENPWANFVTDTLRTFADSDIYFHKASMLPPAFNAGTITLWDLSQCVSFILPTAGEMSDIVRMKLRGSVIRAICEHGVVGLPRDIDSRIPEQCVLPCNTLLHASGLQVTYDLSRSEHDRVVAVTVAGEPLDEQREYHVATLGFLAKGLSGFHWFRGGTERVVVGPMRDAIIAALRVQAKLPAVDGRLIFRWNDQKIDLSAERQTVRHQTVEQC